MCSLAERWQGGRKVAHPPLNTCFLFFAHGHVFFGSDPFFSLREPRILSMSYGVVQALLRLDSGDSVRSGRVVHCSRV